MAVDDDDHDPSFRPGLEQGAMTGTPAALVVGCLTYDASATIPAGSDRERSPSRGLHRPPRWRLRVPRRPVSNGLHRETRAARSVRPRRFHRANYRQILDLNGIIPRRGAVDGEPN